MAENKMVSFGSRTGMRGRFIDNQRGLAHTNKIAQQAQADCTALFRVELDSVCGVLSNRRCKGADVVRGGERVIRCGIGIIRVNKVHIFIAAKSGKQRMTGVCDR